MAVIHTRESTTHTGLLNMPGLPDGYLLGDCACGATYLVPCGEHEYELLDQAHLTHVLGERGPMWLTDEQEAVLLDDLAEIRPDWCDKIDRVPGRNYVMTNDVEKSTPYPMGWL